MALTLYIGGVNRTRDLIDNSLSIDEVLSYQIDTSKFELKGTRPVNGEEIILEENGQRVFGGLVTLPEHDGRGVIKFNHVECADYTEQADRKLVVETCENMTADVIFKDIVAKYCPGFTVNGVLAAPVVEWIRFDYMRPSECFKELCEYVGFHWYVDPYKDFKFFSPTNYQEPAPMVLIPGARFVDLNHKVDSNGLRNRVYVLGGKYLSDPLKIEFVSDGKQREFVLAHEPHSPSITVNEVPKTIGLENVDDESLYDFMYNQRDRYFRYSNQTPTAPEGTTVALTRKIPMDVITMVEDLLSQEAVKAVQGGDGIYEHMIYDDSFITLQAAEAAGQADLEAHKNPKVSGSFETDIQGWKPGQLVTINLPDRGINGTYLIHRVQKKYSNLYRKFISKVEYGGRLLGIADFLQAMVSKQQKGKIIDVQYQTKFVSFELKPGIKIEFIITPRTTPWYAGDHDAIAGEIVALGGG